MKLDGFINGSGKRLRSTDVDCLTHESLKTRIIEFFLDADIFWAVVERKTFQDLLALCNPKTSTMLIKHQALADQAAAMQVQIWQNLVQSIQYDLEDFNSVHFTTDCWTTQGQRSGFMSLTGHCINRKFQLNHTLLGLVHLSGYHTGENLEKYYFDMLEKLDLTKHHGHVTVDNGLNIKASLKPLR
ncbi:hypothetical protein PsorP6_002512 [Peronosclerospora sorghi]|uniref:Uncharacterized protein n=1 Tax=Peronosclerospora sorghi TaxID=230839 RepID=A0ACC0WUR7_9STRA|nr:hypothetical protein PsorP6_002512 [Peronosclerospora sorghi]